MPRQIDALLVDDSPTTRKLIMSALDQTGLAEFRYTEAEDGLDALRKYRPGQTQILFVDMNMPRMNGLEFIRKLHEQHKHCPPAVMITAESNQQRLREAINETGVDAFLLKPVDRDRLRTGLKTLVDSIPEQSGPCVVPHGECVTEAMHDVLDKICQLELTPEPEDEAIRSGDIILGLVSIVGAVQWAVGVGFTRDAAVGVASKFFGSATPFASPEMGDAIGEITNIISGRTKSLLTARDLEVTVSLPTVICASSFQMLIQRRRKSAAAYTHFGSPVGKMWNMVTVGLHPGMVL